MHAIFLPLASASTPATSGGIAAERPGATGIVAPTGTPETNTAGTATSTAPGSQTAPASQPADKPGSPFNMFLLIILMVGVVYFVLFRGQRKDDKKRKDMIAELKKGDRVMTIGGMLAKVVSVDGDEVVLKVDEAANVKATYRKSAIQEVIVDKEEKK
jgi:preprotein translocase subunit YajC